MAGKHILKLLVEENTRISIGDRWLVCKQEAMRIQPISRHPITYIVYECKRYQKKTCTLIETDDEQRACEILKGE